MPRITTAQAVRRDLLVSRSTADSIAGRLGQPTDVVTAILAKDELDGMVEASPLQCLTVWQLTVEGRAIATTYPKAKQYP